MVATNSKIGVVKILGCRCRCGHEWLPRNIEEKPRVCPLCKSPNWDKLFKRCKVQSDKSASV